MAQKIKLKISARLLKKRSRLSVFSTKKVCRFCNNKEQELLLDYKNADLLKLYITERGKILPSRISGICFFHQRKLAHAIKKARMLALIPYTSPRY